MTIEDDFRKGWELDGTIDDSVVLKKASLAIDPSGKLHGSSRRIMEMFVCAFAGSSLPFEMNRVSVPKNDVIQRRRRRKASAHL